ncbi:MULTISPECIES: hypothetical protein [Aerosakkonema]|uniref:hypothetical protein n=1 Tax=Aerosakkonema TaxID=1246629 RepID=UPI0035B79C31
MPIEAIKIIFVGIIAFGIGTLFVEGRQTLEINNLNNRIANLEKQLAEKDKQLKTVQIIVTKQNQKVEEFYKQWKK